MRRPNNFFVQLDGRVFEQGLCQRSDILFLESSTNCSVLALVLFPVTLKNESSWYQNKFEILSDSELQAIKASLKKIHKRDVYVLGDNEDISKLVDLIIRYFSNASDLE